MSELLPTPKTTVEEVFQNLPEASRVFIDYHTACTGCRLARFCTLEEVASIYELNLQKFLDALQQSSKSTIKSPKEQDNEKDQVFVC